MKIKLQVSEDSNGTPIHELYINGERKERIQDLSECPEDAHIGRDLIDGNDIIRYIQMGFAAAKNNEEIEVEKVSASN